MSLFCIIESESRIFYVSWGSIREIELVGARSQYVTSIYFNTCIHTYV